MQNRQSRMSEGMCSPCVRYHAIRLAILISLFATMPLFGGIVEFGPAERDAWFDMLPQSQTITFEGPPIGELDRHFYEDSHGVVFSSLYNVSMQVDPGPWWLLDGHGLSVYGPFGSMVLEFENPMTAFAGDFNGVQISYEAFNGDELIGTGIWGLSGPADFRGFVSDTPFDRLHIRGHSSVSSVDDLHFAAVPAPAAWVLVVVAGLSRVRRRRFSC